MCSGLPVMRFTVDELHAEFGAPFTLLQQEREEHHTPFRSSSIACVAKSQTETDLRPTMRLQRPKRLASCV